jgi:hypothetical protein
VNGDGFADVILGSPTYSLPTGIEIGATYVIFGSATLPTEINSGDNTFFDGVHGFTVIGDEYEEWSGFHLSAAGDVNGDRIDDFIIGSPYWWNDPDGVLSGRVTVVLGHRGFWRPSISITQITGRNGFILTGLIYGEDVGYHVSGVGDINNDGIDDLLVGAPAIDSIEVVLANGGSDLGRAYLVYGSFFQSNCLATGSDEAQCVQCDPGYGLKNGACEECAVVFPGSQSNGTAECVCTSGRYISAGSCLACQLAGGCLTCDMASGDCTSCPADRWIAGTGCSTCSPQCVTCNGATFSCTSCPSGMRPYGAGCLADCAAGQFISGARCVNCTLGNGCHACDMTSGACTSCPALMKLSGGGCEACPAKSWSDGTTATCAAIASDSSVVIIIEFTTEETAEDVKREIEQVLGVDVSVVLIEKGKFEVTVTGGGDAIDLAKKLMDAKDGNSNLLRKIKTVTLRSDALSGAGPLQATITTFVTAVIASVVVV